MNFHNLLSLKSRPKAGCDCDHYKKGQSIREMTYICGGKNQNLFLLTIPWQGKMQGEEMGESYHLISDSVGTVHIVHSAG